ncbi:MAG: nitroreductase family protein [Exilibacterium sp.]
MIDGEAREEDLTTIFKCALTAPDHRKLRPWKFIVCKPSQKPLLQKLILSSTDVNESSDRHSQLVEQVLSAGAAIQNMIIAAEAMGYSCFWRTGEWAYNKMLQQKLGFSDNAIITGFLGLGQLTASAKTKAAKPVSRPAIYEHFFFLDKVVTE